MNTKEQVTDFSLEEPGTGKQVTVSALIKALNLHCKEKLAGESFCDTSTWCERSGERIPDRYRSLIAFAIEGDSEGWYVHVGAMVRFGCDDGKGLYVDFGFAKMWSADEAYDLCREAQRFLSAARWN